MTEFIIAIVMIVGAAAHGLWTTPVRREQCGFCGGDCYPDCDR